MASPHYAPEKKEVEVDTEDTQPDVEERIGRPLHISFQPSANDPRGDGAAYIRRPRSNSRDTIASVRSRAQSNSGIPIEFRTLSIQVSESKHVSLEKVHTDKPRRPEADYFEKLTFHTATVDEVCQQLNVSTREGLSANAANVRLQRDGKNGIPQRRPNYLLKILGYIFGGFCSVLWVGVIIFFLWYVFSPNLVP
jgi:sodium/potassium-transporting ATPase subunit alpha